MKEELYNRTLINKFLAGEISDNEIDVLKAWLEKDPLNRSIFNEENEIWHVCALKTKLDHFKTDKAWADISTQLGLGKERIKHVVILNKKNFRILIAAASIASMVAIGGLTLWLTGRKSDRQITLASTTVRTDAGEKAHILLADSTCVFINSGSTMEYSTDYNTKERKVKLSGEAFFDVRTNPEKPFVVQLGKINVSAAGTRFNILSYDNEYRIETTLEKGKIQVSIAGEEPVDLKPGQQVVYFTKTNKAVVRDVSTETYTSWKENKLRFNDTPFEEVLRKIARRYNVTFEIRNRELLELKYTATFIDESIEDVMQMLKTVSPITYRISYRTTINDKQYLKPKIVVSKRKASI
jgi:ferric-dicitrate binding protein FerR (iron transport regulator)